MNDKVFTEKELNVITKALKVYHQATKKAKENEEIMNSKKFKYGDLVIKKNKGRLDDVLGADINDVGVIVGHYDCDGLDGNFFGRDRDMYRVHYNNKNNYIGEDVKGLEHYTDEIPEHLKNVKWNEVKYLQINL